MAQHTHFAHETSTPGILFADDFDDFNDAAQPSAHSAAAPATPVYSAADIEQARSDGYADGHGAAKAEAAQCLAMAAADCVAKLEAQFGQISADAAAATELAIEAATQLMFSTLSTLLPALCRSHDASEIAGFVRDVITPMPPDIPMRILVAPSLVERVRSAVTETAPEYLHLLSVEPDERMPLGDARLRWEGGTAARHARRTQNAVAAILQQFELLSETAAGDSPDEMTTNGPHAALPAPAAACSIEKGDASHG
jgi:flagellar biosynthesis/type III secretory pathway protein FliH